jgi:hypothetical protein
VDDEALKAMFLAFREGSPAWRDLAAWREPPKKAKGSPPTVILGASAIVGAVILGGVLLALVTGNGGWVFLMFALLFPGLIALAAAVKVAEAQRASTWTKASGQIVRSELVDEKRPDKVIKVPRVEYEFTQGFHKYRGSRVDFAAVVAGPDAKATVARYPVGQKVTVYFNPADPNESVIDRDLPPFFRWIWIGVGTLAAAILFGGLYLLLG